MFLKRIIIPDFKALKNIDLSFDENFSPKVFLPDSLNSEAKSTLLQLVFVLLNCSFTEERKEFVRNILNNFELGVYGKTKELARFDIFHKRKKVRLEFFICNDMFIKPDKGNSLSFNSYNKYYKLKKEADNVDEQISVIAKLTPKLIDIVKDQLKTKGELSSLQLGNKLHELIQPYDFSNKKDLIDLGHNIDRFLSEFNSERVRLIDLMSNLVFEMGEIGKKIKEIEKYLAVENLKFVTNYTSNNNEKLTLLVKIHGISLLEATRFIAELSKKTYLSAPLNQVHLLLQLELRKPLIKTKEGNCNNNYYSTIKNATEKLPGFFVYNFFALDYLLTLIKDAKDKDVVTVRRKGKPGNNYALLLEELNSILNNKKIVPKSDLSGVVFKEKDTGLELNPEDLCHVELKRFSNYLWIKLRKINDSIVLMDGIENTVLPDSQKQMVKDLYEWSPENQYILVNHSYDIYEGATSVQVKEL